MFVQNDKHLVDRLELGINVMNLGAGESSVCNLVYAFLKTHLDGVVGDGRIWTWIEGAWAKCAQVGPVRCGDFLLGLQRQIQEDLVDGGGS